MWSYFLLKSKNKLIGVQSNHGVEYFGGPAAPTWWRVGLLGEAYAENLAKIASELSFLEPI